MRGFQGLLKVPPAPSIPLYGSSEIQTFRPPPFEVVSPALFSIISIYSLKVNQNLQSAQKKIDQAAIDLCKYRDIW